MIETKNRNEICSVHVLHPIVWTNSMIICSTDYLLTGFVTYYVLRVTPDNLIWHPAIPVAAPPYPRYLVTQLQEMRVLRTYVLIMPLGCL